MISQRTADDLLRVLYAWGDRNRVPKRELKELVHEFCEVRGNASFTQSVEFLYELLCQDPETSAVDPNWSVDIGD